MWCRQDFFKGGVLQFDARRNTAPALKKSRHKHFLSNPPDNGPLWFMQTPSLCFLASCACYSAGGRCGVSITHSHSAAALKPLGYGVLKIAIAMEPACTGSQCMVIITCLDFQLIWAPFHKGVFLIHQLPLSYD